MDPDQPWQSTTYRGLRNKGRVAGGGFRWTKKGNIRGRDVVRRAGKLTSIGLKTNMPRRYKPVGVFRPTKRRAGRAGFKRKARVGKRAAKRSKPQGKKAYPKWFQEIVHAEVPENVTMEYTGQLLAAINKKNTSTYYKHLGLEMIQGALVEAIRNNAGLSNSAAPRDMYKLYITDVLRHHVWRNAISNGECEVTAWQLHCRRDYPATNTTGATDQIAPVLSFSSVGGGCLTTAGLPGTAPLLYTQAFTDTNAGFIGGSVKITYDDPSATPFMSSELCSVMKIAPLKIKFPDGFKSHGYLQPGQSISYTGKSHYSKPYMVSMYKFGLSGSGADGLGNQYECLRETPLILLQIKGTPSHDSSTKTLIGLGPVGIDYVQTASFKIWDPDQKLATNVLMTNSLASVSTAEQVDVVTAAVGSEALN